MDIRPLKYNKGFAPILIFIIIATITLIGLITYQIFNNNEESKSIEPTSIKSGIYGRIFGVSDIQTSPFENREYPLSQVGVITLNKVNYNDWLDNLETIQKSRIIREDDISKNYNFSKPDKNGRYLIPLEPDNYAVCFTWEGALDKTHVVNQCVETAIKDNIKVNIDYSSGEFGTKISCLENSSCTELKILEVKDVFRSVSMNKYSYPTYRRSETISINPQSINYGVGSESEHKLFSNKGFEELSNYIKDIGFLSLEEYYGSTNKQSDLFLITVFYDDQREKSVKCYLETCPQEFKKVLSKITSLWNN